jgi:co-chaperonin GroES (HSP10)
MKPTRDNILVERIAGSTETSFGIILKSSLEDDKAIVKEIGPDVTEVKIGDVVFLNWNAATKIEDEKFIVPIKEVIFIYEK